MDSLEEVDPRVFQLELDKIMKELVCFICEFLPDDIADDLLTYVQVFETEWKIIQRYATGRYDLGREAHELSAFVAGPPSTIQTFNSTYKAIAHSWFLAQYRHCLSNGTVSAWIMYFHVTLTDDGHVSIPWPYNVNITDNIISFNILPKIYRIYNPYETPCKPWKRALIYPYT